MQSIHSHIGPFQTPSKLTSKENISKLTVAISIASIIGLLKVKVIKVNTPAELIEQGGDIDDPSRGSFLQSLQEEVGEEEVAQMINCKVHLIPILRKLVWTHHHSSVVDEDVNSGLFLQDLG